MNFENKIIQGNSNDILANMPESVIDLVNRPEFVGDHQLK